MNSSEMFNRDKKAAKLATFLFSIHATSEEILSATEEDWRNIAHHAGCNPPNPKNPKPTIEAVLGKLAGLEFEAMHPPIDPALLAAIDRIDPEKWNTEERDGEDA